MSEGFVIPVHALWHFHFFKKLLGGPQSELFFSIFFVNFLFGTYRQKIVLFQM